MKRAVIAVVAILVGSAVCAPTQGVIIPYEFVRDESILRVNGVFACFIEGTFELEYDLDMGVALFQQVNASLSEEIMYCDEAQGSFFFTTNLDDLFELTKLEAVSVSETHIDLLLEKNIPRFPGADIHLTTRFIGDSLEITGHFGEGFPDGGWYNLNAVAVAVPEPNSLLLLCAGVLCVRKKLVQGKV